MSYRFPVPDYDMYVSFLEFIYERDVITAIRFWELYDLLTSHLSDTRTMGAVEVRKIRDSNPDVYKVFEVRHKLLGS
jgi:hypothetical protein